MSSARNEKAFQKADPAAADTADSAAACKLVVSEGQRLLLAVPGSHAKVGVSVGANRQSIAEWRGGKKLPGEKFRATLEKVHSIPSTSWDAPPSLKPANANALPPASLPSSPPPAEAGEDYAALITVVQGLINGDALKPADKVRAVAEVRALKAQMYREQRNAKKVVSDRDVTRSAVWAQIRQVLGDALKPYPEALTKVVDALKKLNV